MSALRMQIIELHPRVIAFEIDVRQLLYGG
jgi:hypothetical protein